MPPGPRAADAMPPTTGRPGWLASAHSRKFSTGKLYGSQAASDYQQKIADSVYDYFNEVLDKRELERQDDLLSLFLDAEMEGERLTREDILDICFLFLIAGLDTPSEGEIVVAGAVISQATDQGDFPMLLGATVLMSAIVVTVNRLVWRPLYTLAATRFALEN